MSRPKRQCRVDAAFYEENGSSDEDDYGSILNDLTEEDEKSDEGGDEETTSLPEDDIILEEALLQDEEESSSDEEDPVIENGASNSGDCHVSPSGISWLERQRNLGYQLVDGNIRKRLSQSNRLLSTTKAAIRCLGYELDCNEATPAESQRMTKSKRCYLCDVKKDRKTFVCCPKCARPRCNEHRSHLCSGCTSSV